jgi:RNA polymerase sigma factor (sigma-70 family)
MTEITDIPVRPQADARGRITPENMARNRAQEPDLIKAWQQDGCAQSLTLLIKRYAPMIGSQIQKILAGRSVGIAHRPDLEQEANIAFIQAVSNYNPEFGTQLSSFAMNHIRKSLLRYALDFRHSYRIGTSSSERKAFYAALAKRADRIHDGKSDVLSEDDILSIKTQTGSSEKSTRRAVSSIYASRTSVEDAPDIESHENSDDTEHDIALSSAMEALAPFVAKLNERQRAIFQAYLLEEEVDAYALAEQFDLTPERIGQIRREMLADMALFLKKQGIEAADLF